MPKHKASGPETALHSSSAAKDSCGDQTFGVHMYAACTIHSSSGRKTPNVSVGTTPKDESLTSHNNSWLKMTEIRGSPCWFLPTKRDRRVT